MCIMFFKNKYFFYLILIKNSFFKKFNKIKEKKESGKCILYM